MKKKKVFCDGCAFLFYTGIIKKPSCLATAKFVEGPIREKIDVRGITSAIDRNIKNDCPYRSPVSLASWRIKKWLLREMDNGKLRREDNIKKYSFKEEQQHSNEVRKNTENSNRSENSKSKSKDEEEFIFLKEEETGETVFDNRGIEDIDRGGSSDTASEGGDNIQDG